MAALLRGFVAGLPDAVVEQVLQRAEGVPLYAVETIRMLVDRGQLVERDGILAVAGVLGPLEIPDTLHALIASRLDGVPAKERALLQDAAVLGQTFSAPALAAVTGLDQAALAVPLRDLMRKELLALDNDPRSPERGQYGFVQGLIREVAYGTLAKPDRRAKHLAAARFFEALGDEELVGVVATHYSEAYRATPDGPERDSLAAQAQEWLVQAGRRALDLGSSEQALAHFEQALALIEDPAGRAALLDLAGEAATRAIAFERAVAHLEAAIAAHQGTADAEAAGFSTARLASALGDGLGRYADAIVRAEQALRDLGENGSARVRADLASTIARLQSASGAPAAALAWSETALTLAERLDDTELLSRALGERAWAIFNLGRHREAVVLARGRVALAETGGSLVEQAAACLYVSIFVLDDDPREALTLSLEGAELGRRAGTRGLEMMNLLNAAEDAIFLGQWSDARAALTALGQRELGSARQAFLANCEATLAALSGDTARAFEQLEAHAEQTRSDITQRATHLRARAVVNLAADHIEAAHRDAAAAAAADPGINSPAALAVQLRAALWLGDAGLAREALAGMESFHGRWMASVRLTGEAGLASLEGGRRDEAAIAYARALDAWRALDSPLDLALCGLDRAILRVPGSASGDEDDEARAILTELGATPFLARLDRASDVARVAG
jgi:tetratricopeptide (TPR) repeat protein